MTSSPTPMSLASTTSILIGIGIAIFGMLLVLAFGSFMFHMVSHSRQYRLQLEAIQAELKELGGKASFDENDRAKAAGLQKKLTELMRQKGFNELIVGPTIQSEELARAQRIMFHTTIGRTIALAFKEFNSQISWMLAVTMMQFLQQFVTQEIILVSPSVGHAYATAAGIVFCLYFLHKIMYTTADQFVQRRMGTSTYIDLDSDTNARYAATSVISPTLQPVKTS